MYSTLSSMRFRINSNSTFFVKRSYTTSKATPAFNSSQLTAADISAARQYCSSILQRNDTPSYTLQTFIPRSSRDAYLAIRALNVELARIPDLVSNSTVGALRMQFWRDNLNRTFSNAPPKEPVAILLHHALTTLQERHPGLSTGVMKGWFMKVINAREKYMDNHPYSTLKDLENYAEQTYSTLIYLTLSFFPMHSLVVDHIASHVGKAAGIAAVLRGLPLIAFPPPNPHSNHTAMGGHFSTGSTGRQGAVMLPLDVMAKAGVKEEDVLRHGANAQGLRDAVFTVATRANDHLITAREMLKNLKRGEAVDHDFEHEGEEGHFYAQSNPTSNTQIEDIERGFGVLLPSVSTRLWLEQLESADFDVFQPRLRAREWRLPWKAYWDYSRRRI